MIDTNSLDLFSTPIWGYILRTEQYHASTYIEYLLNQQKINTGVTKSNFGGYQTNDDLHREGIFFELTSIIENISNEIFKLYSTDKLVIDALWGNINSSGNYNAAHIHDGVLSGVLYLQVPKNSGKLVLINPAVRSDSHCIRLKNYAIRPEFLGCIIFPSWLEHYVEPNGSNENRISLSFNLKRR
jgi:uncharacterized protein (TIGR02466 family)